MPINQSLIKRQNEGQQDEVDLRRVVVLIGNFEDESVSCVTDSINSLFWKERFSVKGLIELNSYGKVEFAGDIEGDGQWDIFGPYNIDTKSMRERERECVCVCVFFFV